MPGEDVEAGEPVFFADRLAGHGPVFWREYPSQGRKLRPGDCTTNRAGSDASLRIIPDSIQLAGIVAGHDL